MGLLQKWERDADFSPVHRNLPVFDRSFLGFECGFRHKLAVFIDGHRLWIGSRTGRQRNIGHPYILCRFFRLYGFSRTGGTAVLRVICCFIFEVQRHDERWEENGHICVTIKHRLYFFRSYLVHISFDLHNPMDFKDQFTLRQHRDQTLWSICALLLVGYLQHYAIHHIYRDDDCPTIVNQKSTRPHHELNQFYSKSGYLPILHRKSNIHHNYE